MSMCCVDTGLAHPSPALGDEQEVSRVNSPGSTGPCHRLGCILGFFAIVGTITLLTTILNSLRQSAATLPTTTRSMSFTACQQYLRQTIRRVGVRP